MKKVTIKIKCLLACGMIASAISITCAQDRVFKLKKGDEFERKVTVNSICVLQRGEQKLTLNTNSDVTRSYKVNDVSSKGADIIITVNKIIDSINTLDQKVVFNSDSHTDSKLSIQNGLQKMIGKPASVTISENGKILAVNKQLPVSDTLLSFTGIPNERLQIGDILSIILRFPLNPGLKKDYSWTDSVASTVSKFTISAINGRVTTISYKTTDLGKYLNSNTNGVMMVDNETGLIIKRAVQSVTVGYERVRGVVYTATRRTATTEECYKTSGLTK